MSEPQFWALTPRAYQALVDRVQLVRDADSVRAGVIASAIYKAAGMKKESGSTQWAPSDFFNLPTMGEAAKPSRGTPHAGPLPAEAQAQIEAQWLAWAQSTQRLAGRS